jgi:hypothetical protein
MMAAAVAPTPPVAPSACHHLLLCLDKIVLQTGDAGLPSYRVWLFIFNYRKEANGQI